MLLMVKELIYLAVMLDGTSRVVSQQSGPHTRAIRRLARGTEVTAFLCALRRHRNRAEHLAADALSLLEFSLETLVFTAQAADFGRFTAGARRGA